jgi:hypothetical protein
VVSLILVILGSSFGRRILVLIGDSMGFNNVVYTALGGGSIELWQLLLVPVILIIALAVILLYFVKRFEPL